MRWQLVALLVIGGVLALLLWPLADLDDVIHQPPVAPAGIDVDVRNAKVVWRHSLRPSSELQLASSMARPRLAFSHAATCSHVELLPSVQLARSAGNVRPRIIFGAALASEERSLATTTHAIEQAELVSPRVFFDRAESSSSWQLLHGAEEMVDTLLVVEPRIAVGGAAAAQVQSLSQLIVDDDGPVE